MAVLYGDRIFKLVQEGMTEEEAFLTAPKLWRKKAIEHYEYLKSKEEN